MMHVRSDMVHATVVHSLDQALVTLMSPGERIFAVLRNVGEHGAGDGVGGLGHSLATESLLPKSLQLRVQFA